MAAATQDLELFVRDALSRGQSREAIEAALDGFVVAKRVPTVPEHEVQRHTHSDAHYVLLLEGVYLTSAEGAQARAERLAAAISPTRRRATAGS